MAQILTGPFKNQASNQARDTPNGKREILYNPVNMVTLDIGFVMVILAFCGLFMENFLGLNLSDMHCWVLAAGGCLGIWGGFTPERKLAVRINFAVGIFFVLNGIVGFLVGEPGIDQGVVNVPDEMVLKIAPGFLELSTIDHTLHSIVGVLFLIEAFAYIYKIRHPKTDTMR
jgi:hypothetical protein